MRERGFSLLELMVVAAVFTIIAGVVFAALIVAEQRYRVETDLSNGFESANVAIDQMTRDIHQAGFPAANTYNPAVAAANPQLVAFPFAWDPGYPGLPAATVGGGNTVTPGGDDIIIETIPDQQINGNVKWIRYMLPAPGNALGLDSNTLYRASVPKVSGDDPVTDTQNAAIAGSLSPYLDNVMNNANAAQMAAIKAQYPTMFPGGVTIPLFSYTCSTPTGPQPCTTAPAPYNTAQYVQEVYVTLIVEAAKADPKTGLPRVVTLTAKAMVINPNQ